MSLTCAFGRPWPDDPDWPGPHHCAACAQSVELAQLRELAREVVLSLATQFAYDLGDGRVSTGGLSALEEAFDFLGWDDPHRVATTEQPT